MSVLLWVLLVIVCVLQYLSGKLLDKRGELLGQIAELQREREMILEKNVSLLERLSKLYVK